MPEEQDSRTSNSPAPQTRNSVGRWLLAGAICLSAAGYTLGVVLGGVPKDQRLDATNLIVLALAGFCMVLLIYPEALERLRHLKVAGFEFDLAKLKRKQEQQEGQLEAINLLLPLLLREEEGRHLLNLASGETTDYLGNNDMRAELRRLRTMGLIERLEGRHVAEMKDGMKVDLANYVRLTLFGRRMVAQLVEMEKEKAKTDKAL